MEVLSSFRRNSEIASSALEIERSNSAKRIDYPPLFILTLHVRRYLQAGYGHGVGVRCRPDNRSEAEIEEILVRVRCLQGLNGSMDTGHIENHILAKPVEQVGNFGNPQACGGDSSRQFISRDVGVTLDIVLPSQSAKISQVLRKKIDGGL